MTTSPHSHSDWIEVKTSKRRRLTRRLGRRIRDVGKPIIDRDNDGRCLEASDGSFIPCPPGVRSGSTVRNGKRVRPGKPSRKRKATPISDQAINAREKVLPQKGETVDDALARVLSKSVIDEVPGTTVPKKQTAVIDELAFLYEPEDIEQVRRSVYPDYDSWRAWYDQGRQEMEEFLDLFFDEDGKQRILNGYAKDPFNIRLQSRRTDTHLEILDSDGNVAARIKKSSRSASVADTPNWMATIMIESGKTLPDYVREAIGIESSQRYTTGFEYDRSDFDFEDTPAGRYYKKIVDRLFDFHDTYEKWASDTSTKWPGQENKDQWKPGDGFAAADNDTEETLERAIRNLLNPNFVNSNDSENQRSESLHELGHIVLGQGVGRHGDHSANLSIMALLGEESGQMIFNFITAIQWGLFHGRDEVDPEKWNEIKNPFFPVWGDMDPRLVGWWR